MTTVKSDASASAVSESIARLQAHRPQLQEIDTAAGKFFMRRPNGADNFRLVGIQTHLLKAGHTRMPPALIVAWALHDADGKPLFADLSAGMDFCNTLEQKLLYDIYEQALTITGLGERALEDAEKKSLSSQSSESGTSSPSSSAGEP